MTTSRSDPLTALAQTVSVSDAPPIPPELLAGMRRTGIVRPGFESHLTALVDEPPNQTIGRVLDRMPGLEEARVERNFIALGIAWQGSGRMRPSMTG